jgi:hypothetical protein
MPLSASDAFVARFDFTSSDEPGPIFHNLCKEQTTTGHDTLACRPESAELSPHRAEIRELVQRREGNIYAGQIDIAFPLINLSEGWSGLEDALLRRG